MRLYRRVVPTAALSALGVGIVLGTAGCVADGGYGYPYANANPGYGTPYYYAPAPAYRPPPSPWYGYGGGYGAPQRDWNQDHQREYNRGPATYAPPPPPPPRAYQPPPQQHYAAPPAAPAYVPQHSYGQAQNPGRVLDNDSGRGEGGGR